jgi:glyoxylate reductase
VLLPSVLVTRRIPSSVLDLLRAHCRVDAHDGPSELPRDELLRRVADKAGLVAVLTTRVDQELLDAAPGLRVVANIAVGYDNIDVPAARARGVVATNTPDVLTDSVADFTIGLILAVTRRIVEGDRLVRRGEWGGWALDFMLGAELRGKRLGVIGMGRIGSAVAARARAFGMGVVYADPAATPDDSDGVAEHGVAVSLDELLNTSDVVTVHVPLTGATRHLIDQRALARMKRTAYLVNTSRGPVVDEAALAWALREHLIAGAALDVYEREPEVHADLVGLEHVVLAPHLGSATRETRTAMAKLAARNVIEVLAGRPAITPIG